MVSTHGKICAAIFSLIVLAGFNPARAQAPYTYVSSDSITAGDRFGLVIVVPKPPDVQIGRPLFASPPGASTIRFGDLIIFRRLSTGNKALPPGAENTIADTLVYEATTFALDTAHVPPLNIRLLSSGDTTSVTAEAFSFPVVSLVVDERSDIEDVTPLSRFPAAVWPWLLFLTMAVVGFLLVRYKDKLFPTKAVPEQQEPGQPVERPIDEALRRLKELEMTDIETEANIKMFFVDLTDIIRTYVSRRLDIPALESTSTELKQDLHAWDDELGLDGSATDRLSSILEIADLAKYADSKPAVEFCRDARRQSEKLVIEIDDIIVEREKAEQAKALARENSESPGTADDGNVETESDVSGGGRGSQPEAGQDESNEQLSTTTDDISRM